MKKIIFALLFVSTAAMAEEEIVAAPEPADAPAEIAAPAPDDFSGRMWIIWGINGSVAVPPKGEVVARIAEVIGKKPKISDTFVGMEARLGYNINPWLGLWAGGIWYPKMPDFQFINRKYQKENIPGYGHYHTETEMLTLHSEVEYKEYFAGTRVRLGETNDWLFSFLTRFTRVYWFADIGITRRDITAAYWSKDFGIEREDERRRTTELYFGTGTEIMFDKKSSINLDANATTALKNFDAFGLSVIFKRYF